MNHFTAAVIQAASLAFDTPQTLEKLADLSQDAANQKASLAVFPEAFIGGYPKGHSFNTVMGERLAGSHDWYARYWDSAIDVLGPVVEQLSEIARSTKMHLVVGVIERELGTLYCSILFFSDAGFYLGKHRKLMPTAAERLVWGMGDGSTMPVFKTPLGNLGGAICWENYMPLYRTTLYSKGIEIYCAPTVDNRERWTHSMQHIALEGRCFVLSANAFCQRKHYPHDFETAYGNDPETVLINGGSCIVSPQGQLLAGPVFGKETILTAEIDKNEITKAKYDFDPVGHYARPDVFQLLVDETEKKTVKTLNTSKLMTTFKES